MEFNGGQKANYCKGLEPISDRPVNGAARSFYEFLRIFRREINLGRSPLTFFS
jgi:hypothetical protein